MKVNVQNIYIFVYCYYYFIVVYLFLFSLCYYIFCYIYCFIAKDSNDKTHNNNIDDNDDNKNNSVGMSSVQLMYLWCKNKGLGSTGRDLSVLEVLYIL